MIVHYSRSPEYVTKQSNHKLAIRSAKPASVKKVLKYFTAQSEQSKEMKLVP